MKIKMKMKNFIYLLTPFLIMATSLYAQDTPLPEEERTRAALVKGVHYLETRAQNWLQENSCISCHTTVTSMMVNGILRRDPPSVNLPEEAVVRAFVENRVQTWNSANFAPLYGGSLRERSLSTESVLNALALTWDDMQRGRSKLAGKTCQALSLMAHQQRPGGHWIWLTFRFGPDSSLFLKPWEDTDSDYWAAAFVAGTLKKAMDKNMATDCNELDRIRNILTKVRTYLTAERQSGRHRQLYHQLFTLWADHHLGSLLSANEKNEIINKIGAIQRDDGGWSLRELYPPGTPGNTSRPRSDGHATGIITYIFLDIGLPLSDPKIAKAVQWLKAPQNQATDGAWRAVSLNRPGHGRNDGLISDSATAYVILALDKITELEGI